MMENGDPTPTITKKKAKQAEPDAKCKITVYIPRLEHFEEAFLFTVSDLDLEG
jgi:hypothetical protein